MLPSELLRKLVEIKSPSGREGELAKFVVSYLEGLGLSPEVDRAGNVILDRGAEIWVTAHMDTVNTDYPFREHGKLLYGTGVADDKASIAAMLLACKEGSFNCAFFVDEEETGIGSQCFADEREAGKAIVMEPTELKICTKHWGVVEFLVTVEGEQTHAAVPKSNAIENALKLIESLKTFKARLNLLEIKSEPENLYVTPYRCHLKAELLLEFSCNLLDVLEFLESHNAEVLELSDPFDCEGEVVKALEKAMLKAGIKPEYTYMPSWTDAVNLKKAGWDVTVFGPGRLELCHTPSEFVNIDEVVKAAEVLKNL